MKEERNTKLLGALVALVVLITLFVYGNIGTSILWHEKNAEANHTPRVIAMIDDGFPTPYHAK